MVVIAPKTRGRGRRRGCNAHPQSLGPTLKLFFKFTSFYGCFVMCVLVAPSSESHSNYQIGPNRSKSDQIGDTQ